MQPAVKCCGPGYLRIIYDPEYLLPANLERCARETLEQSALWQAESLHSGLRLLNDLSYYGKVRYQFGNTL